MESDFIAFWLTSWISLFHFTQIEINQKPWLCVTSTIFTKTPITLVQLSSVIKKYIISPSILWHFPVSIPYSILLARITFYLAVSTNSLMNPRTYSTSPKTPTFTHIFFEERNWKKVVISIFSMLLWMSKFKLWNDSQSAPVTI